MTIVVQRRLYTTMTKFSQAIVTSILVVIVSGCSSNGPDPSKDNSSMRDTMTNKKPFNINDVPPQYRDQVMKMRGGAGGASKGNTPTTTPPPSGN